MSKTKSLKVLVAPLNWGLGHATRCVPIVRALLDQNTEVIIGADGNAAEFLKKEFPKLHHICIPDINMHYYKKIPASISILLQTPKFLFQIVKEHKFIDKLISEMNIDIIISDNRYGVRSKKIKSILISHQLQIKSSFFDFLPNYFIRKQLSKFNQCFVPDFKTFEHSLAGELSHPKQINNALYYIEPLCRFENRNITLIPKQIPVIISGPEPLKTQIIKRLMEVLKNTEWSFVLVLGDVKSNIISNQDNLKVISHLETQELENLILQSPLIISSGGYSSLMDYYVLQKKTIFIPFPGQTEQEYLAKFHEKSALFTFLSFNKCDLLPDLILKKYDSTNILNNCNQNIQNTPLIKCISNVLKPE